jgi:hypothetical protein
MEKVNPANLDPTEWGDTLTPEALEELSNGKGDDDNE